MNDSVDNQFEDLSLNHINLPYIDPGEFIAANVYLFIYSTCYELFLLFLLNSHLDARLWYFWLCKRSIMERTKSCHQIYL